MTKHLLFKIKKNVLKNLDLDNDTQKIKNKPYEISNQNISW